MVHKHVLEFLGICYIDDHLHLVSPYLVNGNLSDYLSTHPTMNRIKIVSVRACGVAFDADVIEFAIA